MPTETALAGSRTPQWVSAHLFFAGRLYARECDDIIVDFLDPFVTYAGRCVRLRRWFFIRYSEGISHIRFRLSPEDPSDVSRLRGLLIDAARMQYPEIQIDGRAVAAGGSPASIAMHLCWVSYEPEFARYGGPSGIEVAEEFFEHSSLTAINVIRQTRHDSSGRLGRALLANVAAMHAVVGSRSGVVSFARSYASGLIGRLKQYNDGGKAASARFTAALKREGSGLRDYVAQTLDCLEAGGALPADIVDARSDFLRARARLSEPAIARAIRLPVAARQDSNLFAVLAPSYIHMMNNRIGIRPLEEAYIASLIVNAMLEDDPRQLGRRP